jgi:hypothetical protein
MDEQLKPASLSNRLKSIFSGNQRRRVEMDAHELELQHVVKTYF